jgi:hypothetical protein
MGEFERGNEWGWRGGREGHTFTAPHTMDSQAGLKGERSLL